MFSKKTVFVLGAGSSYEAGMPLGSQLAADISDMFPKLKDEYGRRTRRPIDHISGALQAHERKIIMQAHSEGRPFNPNINLNNYFKAGEFLREGIVLANSIDDFLDLHRDNKDINLIGKLAIIHGIQVAESRSKLYASNNKRGPEVDMSAISDTYYVKLFKMLSKGVPKSSIKSVFQNVSFITFNYDRTLEHFFIHALQRLYGIDPQEAADIVKDVPIWHPYGTIGDLSDLNIYQSNVTSFGTISENEQLLGLTPKIKTYTEQAENHPAMSLLREALLVADNIVFLGFGFHAQNLSLLQPDQVDYHKIIYATATGFSDQNVGVIRDRLSIFLPTGMAYTEKMNAINVSRHHSCSSLLDDFSLYLS